MSRKTQTIASLEFNPDGPTELSFDQLRTWIIWQFPRKFRDGHCGAVHPPIANHGWLPAAIWPERERVAVHAHITQDFESPADAANWLERDG